MANMRAEVENRGAADEQRKLVDQLIALIPAEAVGLYVAAIAVAVEGSEALRWACLVVVTILTPLWVLWSFWHAKDENKGFPWLEMGIGTTAFIAWSTTVPKGPWNDIGLPTWVGTMIVIFASAILLLTSNLAAAWKKHARG